MAGVFVTAWLDYLRLELSTWFWARRAKRQQKGLCRIDPHDPKWAEQFFKGSSTKALLCAKGAINRILNERTP